MGSPLFLGAEPEDYVLAQAWYRGSAVRTGSYSRGSLYSGTANNSATGSFAACTDLSACACFNMTAYTTAAPFSIPFFGVGTGGVPQIGLNYNASTRAIELHSWNGATYDVIQTHIAITNTAVKWDITIDDYATAGCRVRVWYAYVNSADPQPYLMFDETGSYGNSANLDEIILCTPYYAADRLAFDEVVIHEDPTLRMRIATGTPNAAG